MFTKTSQKKNFATASEVSTYERRVARLRSDRAVALLRLTHTWWSACGCSKRDILDFHLQYIAATTDTYKWYICARIHAYFGLNCIIWSQLDNLWVVTLLFYNMISAYCKLQCIVKPNSMYKRNVWGKFNFGRSKFYTSIPREQEMYKEVIQYNWRLMFDVK